MEVSFFCPRWGSEHIAWKIFIQQVKASGYNGVECSPPGDDAELNLLMELLQANNLKYIAQHWETEDGDFETHMAAFEKRLLRAAGTKPLFINSQTGKDYFSFEQNEALLLIAKNIAEKTGVKIIHETHRGKFSFAAHITKNYLQQMPRLQLCLDVSHWCATAHSYLKDQAEALQLAMERTAHIHARVGHTQGPQVPDPRDTMWKEAVDFHLQCWDKIISLKKESGAIEMTITPEFGAPPYLTLLPFSHEPICNQWEVNVYMMNMLKERYSE
jgi:sugar phosphate isomerase/epimerase